VLEGVEEGLKISKKVMLDHSAVNSWERYARTHGIPLGRIEITNPSALDDWVVANVNRFYDGAKRLVRVHLHAKLSDRTTPYEELDFVESVKGKIAWQTAKREPNCGFMTWLHNSMYGELKDQVIDLRMYRVMLEMYNAQHITEATKAAFFGRCDRWFSASPFNFFGRRKYYFATRVAVWEDMSRDHLSSETCTNEGRLSFLSHIRKLCGGVVGIVECLGQLMIRGCGWKDWQEACQRFNVLVSHARRWWSEMKKRFWRWFYVQEIFIDETTLEAFYSGDEDECLEIVSKPLMLVRQFEDHAVSNIVEEFAGHPNMKVLEPETILEAVDALDGNEIVYLKYLGVPFMRPSRHFLGPLRRFAVHPPKPDLVNLNVAVLDQILDGLADCIEGTFEDLELDSEPWKQFYLEEIKPNRDGMKRRRDALYLLRQTEQLYSGGAIPSREVCDLFAEALGISIEQVLVGMPKNPDLHTKTDEVLIPKRQEEWEFYIKGRPIVASSPHTFLCCAYPVHNLYAELTRGTHVFPFLLGSFRTMVLLDFGPANVSILSGLSEKLLEFSEIYTKYIYVRQSGDDAIAVLYNNGVWKSLENDFKSFDQTETNPYVHRSMLRFYARFFSKKTIARWYSNFGGVWGRIFKLYVRVALGTGNVMTTLWNSVWGITFICYALIVHGSDEFTIPNADSEWGMISKPRWRKGRTIRDVLYGATFLKGWWVDDEEGRLAWTPLPSRILKLFKLDIKRNPNTLVGSPSHLVVKSYEMCLGLRYYNLDPFLSEVTRRFVLAFRREYPRRARVVEEQLLLRSTFGSVSILKRHWVQPEPSADQTIIDCDEAYMSRYGITPDSFTALSAFEHLGPTIVRSPFLTALAKVDYA
jgi:hypothetical protein